MHDRTGEKMTQYAARFRSTPGKHDGLYWQSASGDDISPMDSLVADAEAEGYDLSNPKSHHQPYHGYYFHILTSQGENAPGGKTDYVVNGHMVKAIAYPDEWGTSGIMTFLVNQDGKVLQKDLGQNTVEQAAKITAYNPDSTCSRPGRNNHPINEQVTPDRSQDPSRTLHSRQSAVPRHRRRVSSSFA